ncbi:MAG: transcriptional repressor LexA [Armatimonadota bacterium]
MPSTILPLQSQAPHTEVTIVARDKLTPRRKRILDFIEKFTAEEGYPPTVREIGAAVGLKSSSSVQFHLVALRKMGYLERDGNLTRAIRLSGRGSDESRFRAPVYVPLVGQVAAGEPILAQEDIEDFLPFPADMASGEGCFLLRVKGDSMINAGILDGDYVLVQQQEVAESGDKVVALIGDEATVKTFWRHGDQVELRPENDDMEPIPITDDIEILGKVRAVIRRIG